MYTDIKYELNGSAAVITLNRPDNLNALTYTMLIELQTALGVAEKDKNVIGIVITGEGRGFSAGMDMGFLKDIDANGEIKLNQPEALFKDTPGDKEMGDNFHVTYTYMMSIRKPIVAAINGPCAGLSLAIAMFCDIRFATENTKINTAFSARGLVAEHGLSWILPRIIGPSKTLDLLWSSRTIMGPEAKEIGLVDFVVPQEEIVIEAVSYINTLAKSVSPISMQDMKKQVYRHLNMSLKDAMNETNEMLDVSIQKPDFREGVMSFVEKRAPKFERVSVD